MSKTKIVIVMQGGIIQNITSNNKDLSIRLIDWDLDETDPHDQRHEEVPFKDCEDKAYVVDMDFVYMPSFFKILKRPMK